MLNIIQFKFTTVLQCAPGISKWSLYFRFSSPNFVFIYFSHARYKASPVWLPSSSSHLARTTNYEDPFRCYLPPQIPVLKNSQSVFVSYRERQRFVPYERTQKIMVFNIYFGLLSLLITGGRHNLNWHRGKRFPNLIFIFFINGFSWNV